MKSNTLKKNIVLVFLFFIGLSALQAQVTSNATSPRTLKIEATKIVEELKEKIEVSNYQAKSVIKALVALEQKRNFIEQRNIGSTQKSEELEALKAQEKNTLRTILNDQQYDMLVSIKDSKQ